MKTKRRSAPVTPPIIQKGQELDTVIFSPAKKPLTRSQLQSALGPVVRAWLRAACIWDELTVGDHRFVVFAFHPTPKVHVYVQFWSEPMEAVLWEVSSGRWHGPRDKWLADRTKRIEAFGFTLEDGTENYAREVSITSATEAARVACEVVDIFYNAFDYRGQEPLTAKLVHEGRSAEQPVYEAFTPEDVSKLFAAHGFRVEQAVTTMTRCRNHRCCAAARAACSLSSSSTTRSGTRTSISGSASRRTSPPAPRNACTVSPPPNARARLTSVRPRRKRRSNAGLDD